MLAAQNATPLSYWLTELVVAVVAGLVLAALIALPRKVKKELNDAIDERVNPKFQLLRDELREHTDAEKELVRDVVKEELAPLHERLGIGE